MNHERTFDVKPLTAFVNHAIYGAGGGGGSSARAPIEAPDSLRSIAYARILDLVSEGEIYGFADQTNPLTCVYLNETPVQNADGSLNFKNIQIDSRVGTQTQDYIKGFGGVENELIVGVELRADTPYTRAVTNLNLSAVRVRLSVPALQKTNTTNGDVTGYNVAYALDLSVDGGSFIEVFRGSFAGKASSKYERTHRIDLPTAVTGWQVRVRRTTADTDDTYIQDTTIVESMAEIIDAKFRLPMSAVVGVVVDAEQFNNIPSRAYDIKGRLVRVPSNYDPDTRTYTGIWDGTFQTAWSDNAAWCFYDMALHSRYGLGHLLTPAMVNKWNLYRISQYCDGMVDDGFGGLEPRFTINTCLETQEDATRVMMNLATVFRGIMYAAGGELVAVGDMPEDPKYTYTPSNVIDGKFVYAGSGRKVRHTVALVSWSDQSDFGRQKIEYIQDEDGIARYGIQQTEVIAFGCTSRGQARRLGKYILTTERYETDGISFSVGLDGTLCPPGTIVYVSDPLRAGRRTGGRMRSTTINTVTVDAVPIGNVGDKLVAILPSGQAEDRPISDITGNVFTVSPAFSAVPVAGSMWAIESDELPLQRFRILSVLESTDETRVGHDVTAIQHVEGKFAYVEDGIMIDVPGVPDVPSSVVPSPTGIGIAQRTVADANTTQVIVNLFWTKVASAVNYTAMWRQGEGNWIDLGTVTAVSMDIPNVQPGPFEVQVTAVNALGVKSVPAFGGPFDISINTTPPGYVQDLIDTDEILSTDLAQEVIDRVSGDAAVAADAAAELAAEAATRAADDLAVASAAADALLNAQTEIEAAITEEQTIRQSADESLASAISSIVAGTGEQFDSKKVWYFDASVDGFTGNGAPSASGGYLRPANHATDPYVQSPAGMAVDGATYKYVKLRIKKTGAPVWDGTLRGYDATSTLLNTDTTVEPAFSVDGIATIDFKDVTWTGTVDHIRIDLSTAQTATDYYEIDWIAVGRPSPGASVAALQDEAAARASADSAEATARSTLATQLRGAYTGTDVASLTTGLVYSERQARVTADSAIASDVTALEVRMDDAELDISSTASAVTALDTRVDDVEGVNTAQASSITSLNSRMTSAEGVNTSQATAISGLTTRITDAEGDIDTQATDITSLQVGMGNIGGDNLLKNAGFEVNTTGTGLSDDWALSASSVTAVSYSNPASDLAGSAVSQRIQASVINGSYLGVSQPVTGIEAGQAYSLSARVKASATGNPGTPTTQIIIQWRDASNAVVSPTAYSTVVSNVGGTWKSLKLENVVAPAGADRCNVYVRTSTTMTATLQMWMDNVSFQKGAVATNFAPGVSDTASAVQSLTARVTTAEGDITSTSNALTALTATVGTKANSSAVTALEARVTATEGVNTSQASAITTLDADLDDANASITRIDQVTASASVGNALPNPSFENNLDQWTMTTAQASLRTDPANARTGTRMLNIVGHATAGLRGTATSNAYIPVKAGQIVKLGFYAGAYGAAIAPVGAYLRYDVRWYDTNKAQLATGGYVATNCTTAAPTVRWTQVSGSITVPADAVYMRVVVITNATSGNWVVDDLTVEPLTDLAAYTYASSGVTLDVNGYMTGYRTFNDGTTSGFDIVVDNFRLLKPGGGARLEMSSGNMRAYDPSNVLRVRLGVW